MAKKEHSEIEGYIFRVLIAGSRRWSDYPLFSVTMWKYLDFIGADQSNCLIVSGAAYTGADDLAIRFCEEHGWDWVEFPAKWEDLDAPGAVIRTNKRGQPYNVKAGFDRNREMKEVATHLLAFWDYVSPGTRDMIALCSHDDAGIKTPTVVKIPECTMQLEHDT